MKYYISNDMYGSSLEHFGVPGMKWGVRKARPVGNGRRGNGNPSLARSAFDHSMLRRTGDRISGTVWRKKTKFNRFRNAKGIGNKASEVFGYGNMRTNAEARARTQEALTAHSKTKLAKAYHRQQSANAGHLGNYASDMKKSSTGDKALELFVPVKFLQTPYQRLSGRTTSIGKNALQNTLTLGTLGLFNDMAHIGTQRALNRAMHNKPSKHRKNQ